MSHLKKKNGLVPVFIILLWRLLRYPAVFESHMRVLRADYPAGVRIRDRLKLIHLAHWLPYKIECGSSEVEVLSVVDSILSCPQDMVGCVIGVGVFKGGASCVYSKACKLVNRELYLIDSYEGLPDNHEVHRNLHKLEGTTCFAEGRL